MKGTAAVISAVTFFFGFPRQRVFFPRTRKKDKVDRKWKHFKGNRQKTTRHARVFIGISTRPNSFTFRATTNKKLKETVALELSFVNSNLQLLKEQLAELNSSVELYQNEKR